jgi:hypothetical protein
VLGIVCLAAALARAEEILRPRVAAGVQLAVLALVVGSALPYFDIGRIGVVAAPYLLTPAKVLADDYRAPNSSYYAFRGMDVQTLGWVRDGRLVTNTDLPVPLDAVPLEFELSLPPGTGEPRFVANGKPREPVSETTSDSVRLFRAKITPRCGLHPAGDNVVRFELPGEAPTVTDLRFQAGDGLWFRPVPAVSVSGNRLGVEVPTAGAYQLPVLYTPLTRVRVNGGRVDHWSADRYMQIVQLPAGRSEVSLTQKWHPRDAAGTGAVVLFWIAVLLFPGFRGRVFGRPVTAPITPAPAPAVPVSRAA